MNKYFLLPKIDIILTPFRLDDKADNLNMMYSYYGLRLEIKHLINA